MAKLIIFDTETTGLDDKDRIIQVGAIVVDSKDLTYAKAYDELCSSDKPINIEAMSTHGIRQVQLEGKPSFAESEFFHALKQLNNEENYLIAHNLDFDLGMLKKEGFENKMQLIDTLQCAKHLFEIGDEIYDYKVPNHKLQTFRYMMLSQEDEDVEAKKYNVEIKAHNAIGDVVILKLFLRKVAEKVKEKYEIKDYAGIMNKLVELTKLPAEVKVINFGKHSGKTVIEIEAKDSGWIDWLFKEQKKQKKSNDPKFNKDIFYTLEKVIQNRNHKS